MNAIRIDSGQISPTQINEIKAISCVLKATVDFKLNKDSIFYNLVIKDSKTDAILETRPNLIYTDADSLKINASDYWGSNEIKVEVSPVSDSTDVQFTKLSFPKISPPKGEYKVHSMVRSKRGPAQYFQAVGACGQLVKNYKLPEISETVLAAKNDGLKSSGFYQLYFPATVSGFDVETQKFKVEWADGADTVGFVPVELVMKFIDFDVFESEISDFGLEIGTEIMFEQGDWHFGEITEKIIIFNEVENKNDIFYSGVHKFTGIDGKYMQENRTLPLTDFYNYTLLQLRTPFFLEKDMPFSLDNNECQDSQDEVVDQILFCQGNSGWSQEVSSFSGLEYTFVEKLDLVDADFNLTCEYEVEMNSRILGQYFRKITEGSGDLNLNLEILEIADAVVFSGVSIDSDVEGVEYFLRDVVEIPEPMYESNHHQFNGNPDVTTCIGNEWLAATSQAKICDNVPLTDKFAISFDFMRGDVADGTGYLSIINTHPKRFPSMFSRTHNSKMTMYWSTWDSGTVETLDVFELTNPGKTIDKILMLSNGTSKKLIVNGETIMDRDFSASSTTRTGTTNLYFNYPELGYPVWPGSKYKNFRWWHNPPENVISLIYQTNCFIESLDEPDLDFLITEWDAPTFGTPENSNCDVRELCMAKCQQLGYQYASVNQETCRCGDAYGKYGRLGEENCDQPCAEPHQCGSRDKTAYREVVN